ncbi:hypothetical protein KAFR_0F02090 [Kazachstania africana CBS 2517]|uniref:FAD synthase n=1 Tax=Kazachstania africana (strain ATCC 22294 / BCRC 22015 / CBS 2517 / CECT 1963 / NBRC 1671 / NRRL Y-8276) TaxID=1071382 RepID=H2AWQ6_KAZAF|nr:hypothetical protein KAFR_0F02090 [Kazachstania africana CBS 2517]CCF58806.1 hypothetical protein KAFR_0F02090 [Kazachstania africana CBS 2517]
MTLARISETCYKITKSYLNLTNRTSIITETQNAINLTRHILINDVFTRWSPLNGEISFSYNGGKDCQVLLLLYLSCLWEFFVVKANESQFDFKYHRFPMTQLPTVFINSEETWPTLENFMNYTQKRYHLSLYESMKDDDRYNKSMSMSDAFQDFLYKNPVTKAIVIGIRHTDPFGEHLKSIQKTDSNWPDFIRLQPLLHWKLGNIWSFLLFSNEPICGLYNYGFTSIGNVHETKPNPFLKIENSSNDIELPFSREISNSFNPEMRNDNNIVNFSEIDGTDKEWLLQYSGNYLPGWYLTDDSLERAGRFKKPKA